jgi:hypothetical protein
MVLGSAKTQVVVGSQVFYVPSDKIQEVYSLLSRLQSLAVNENTVNGVPPQYNGLSIIRG